MEFESFNTFFEAYHDMIMKSEHREVTASHAVFTRPYNKDFSYPWAMAEPYIAKQVYQQFMSILSLNKRKNLKEVSLVSPKARTLGILNIFLYTRETVEFHVSVDQIRLYHIPRIYETLYQLFLAVQMKYYPRQQIGKLSISFGRVYENEEDLLPLHQPEIINLVKPFGKKK